MLTLILQGIVPVVALIAVGFYFGRTNVISKEGAKNFSAYIVTLGLPSTLFAGIFNFTPQQLENTSFLLVMLLSLTIPFFMSVALGSKVFRQPTNEAGLFACNSGYPDMAYFGLPVLLAIVHEQALLPVIVGNLVTSIFIVPTVVYMLHRGGNGGSGKPQISFIGNMASTFQQPVVWAPILGLIMVLIHIHLPPLVLSPIRLIGGTTGGLALFTLGVLLSHLKFHIDWPTIAVILVKNMFMPALAFVLAKLFHLDGPLAKGVIIAAACPAATIGAMLSAEFQVAQERIPAQILASNLLGVGTMAFWIYVAESL